VMRQEDVGHRLRRHLQRGERFQDERSAGHHPGVRDDAGVADQVFQGLEILEAAPRLHKLGVHDLEPEEFFAEVHSFAFWFQSVEGYLVEHPYGVDPNAPIPELEESEKDALVATLSTPPKQ